ncbi:MAG: hypothetical protein PHG64_02085 [Paludibacter sp.]|nr:hypothetical protein [Paludibacter sp.]
MKTKTFLFFVIALFLMGMGVGCEKEKNELDCYTGKIIQLKGKCNSIVKITSAPKNGLSIGETVSFNSDLLNQDLKIGSIIEFKIIQYEKWNGPATADCIWPTYIANIEP